LTRFSIFVKQVLVFDKVKPFVRVGGEIMGLLKQTTFGIEHGFPWVGEIIF